MSPAGSDAADALLRALRNRIGPFAAVLEVEEQSSQDWSSITFAGVRLRFRLRLEGEEAGPAADALLALVPDGDLALRGHILGDLAVTAEERDQSGKMVRLGLKALTVEAGWL